MKKILALAALSILSLNVSGVFAMENAGALITQEDAIASQAEREQTSIIFAKVFFQGGKIVRYELLHGFNAHANDYEECVRHLHNQYAELTFVNGLKHTTNGLWQVAEGVFAVVFVAGQKVAPYVVDFTKQTLIPVVGEMAKKLKEALAPHVIKAVAQLPSRDEVKQAAQLKAAGWYHAGMERGRVACEAVRARVGI